MVIINTSLDLAIEGSVSVGGSTDFEDSLINPNLYNCFLTFCSA